MKSNLLKKSYLGGKIMKKKGLLKGSKWLALGILVLGALQIGINNSFAAESEAKVITEHVLLDSLSTSEQEGLIAEEPSVTIVHDEETFKLVYKEKEETATTESTADSTTDTHAKEDKVPLASSSESTATSDSTLLSTNQENIAGMKENQKLPKTGEKSQNKGFIILGVVFLLAGGVLLIWKRKQRKQLLLLIVIGGAGISIVSQAATLGLPESKIETVAKGSNYQPRTEVNGYEYVGYVHSTENSDVPPIPEGKEGSVIVHYVDEAQEKVHEDLLLTGKIGDSYSVDAIQIPGMSVKEVIGNPSGVFEEQKKEVTFIYENEKQIGHVTIDFTNITSQLGRYYYVYSDENDLSSEIHVKAEGFLFLDTGYRIPKDGKLELTGEVGAPISVPAGLELDGTSHPLALIYHDSEGQEKTAVIRYTSAYINGVAPSKFTAENQTITFNMSVPN